MVQQERMKALYSFLEEWGDQWISQKELLNRMAAVYPTKNDKAPIHDSSARRALTADIQAIGKDGSFPRIILHGNRGVKLANKSEMTEYLRRWKIHILSEFKRFYAAQEKAGMDGQLDLRGEVIEAFSS